MRAARTVILAAGDFPKRGGEAWNQLAAARFVVACDSAAIGYKRRFGRWPDVVIGDMDSLVGRYDRKPVKIIKDSDQETNDLEKAIVWCRKNAHRDIVIVGASGKREDHTIGNVFRSLHYKVRIITENGVFYPVEGAKRFKSREGAGVSIFAVHPLTEMTSKGLKWPLDGVKFDTLFRATLNRASGKSFSVTASHPVSVFISF